MPIPTWRLAALVAASAVLTALLPVDQPSGMLVVTSALLVIGALDASRSVHPRLLGVERTVAGVAVLGEPLPIRWRVTNQSTRRVHVAVADELAPSLRAVVRRFRLVLPAGASATVEGGLRPSRRGRFTPTQIVVRVDGPWRLAARQRARSVPGVIRVHPVFRSRDEAELRIRRARLLEIGLRSAAGRGGGTDFDQLREWTDDDDPRRIDWAATARTGRAIVRTYRAERNQTVVALLDSGRLMAGRVGSVPRLEHALDALFAVTTVATRLGDRLGMVAFDHTVRSVVAAGSGPHQFGRVLDACFDLEPRLVESDYRRAFLETLARFRRRTMIIVFTDLVEQAVELHLLPALPLVARSHLVVIAAVRDPSVEEWASTRPADSADAYRSVAALDNLVERRRVAARLRATGAVVVDVVPSLLAPRLADTYLRTKATGRL